MSFPVIAEKPHSALVNVSDVATLEDGRLTTTPAVLAQAAAKDHALTPLQAIRTYWPAFFWCQFVCMGALMWGYDWQANAGLLSVPSFRRDFGYEEGGQYVLAAHWQSAFNSLSSVGGMLGGFSLGYISDRFGRRFAVAFCCLISIVGIFVQFFTTPHKNGQLLAGKFINGYALGMYVSVASSYCAEISPLPLRGIATASVNLWIELGGLITNCVIKATGNLSSAYAYRLPFALQWIFPAFLLVGLPFAPESPWWLVRKGHMDDARKVVARLAGPAADIDLQLRQIQETVVLEDSHAADSTYADCFRGVNLRRTIVASMVFVLQQVAGVVFVLGFSTYFFELAGFADSKAFDLGVGVTAIGVVGNLLTFYTVNYYGRRFIFNWTMFALTIVLLLIGFLAIPTNNQGARWAIAVFTLVYNFIYQTGIGPLGYVIYSEVPSAKLRSKTVGIGILTNSLCTMVTTIVIPYLVNPDEANLGGKVGFIFGGLSAFGTIWAWFYIPETKNRTVDEIDMLFERGVSPRKFASHKFGEEEIDDRK
ncbi:hypothetical protein AcW1_008337 [Taiwanofungus camphoratus]|nr:hypothetical protein AcW1_008337 [Antrodia cinnamomea]KAI0956140.1 hypothetical protein AcV7_006620 [Antrodia cinnamomea]